MKKPQFWLAISLILMFVGSISANFFNTSGYSVKVTEVSFKTDKGTLDGLLYMPAGASATSPRPTIVTTHGYLNSKEMQDAPAIEMSRRGYVVLALDLYSHGNSVLDKVPTDNAFFSFWPSSSFDAVQYMYNQPYVLKDKKGNGIIGVSGHSMGGFSSTMAVYYDEQAYQKNLKEAKPAVRKISAVITAGADYRWATFLGMDAEVANKSYANRTAGAIAGLYDEFFFDKAVEAANKTVVSKDYVNTVDGKAFLGNPESPKVGVFYPTEAGGKRIIYEPREAHAMNPISPASTKAEIEFYNTAFSEYAPSTSLSSSSQTWWLKELFETVGLVGFFLLFVPLIQLLFNVAFLKTAQSEAVAEFNGPTTGNQKLIYWIVIAFSSLFPAIFYPTLMDKQTSGLNLLKYIALIIFAVALIGGIVSWIKHKEEKLTIGCGITAIAAFIMLGLTVGANNLFQLSTLFNEPETNSFIYWSLVVTAGVLVILSLVYYLVNKPSGMNIRQYGFVVSWKKVVAAFATAAIAASAGYIILYIIDAFFKTDFRIWTFAVRSINKSYIITALGYMPFYFLYFFVNGIAVNINTNSKYMRGIKGYLVAYLLNIGGLLMFMIVQYGKFFITGTATFPDQSLNSIVMLGLIPTLLIATILTKKCYEKTNNVYTGAFLNTFLMTMITVASTTMYLNLVK